MQMELNGDILLLWISLFYVPMDDMFNVPGKDDLLLKNKRKLLKKKEA